MQPFKCGPDYIDTKFHSMATGNESVNLDTWLASKEHLKNIYRLYGKEADACVIEGVMGLFDGYDRVKGSSAEIAIVLDVPVLLVVNARSTAYTVAAQIYGVKNFCPELRLAGVVFNNVASESHFSLLKDACADAGVECFGYMPKSDGLEIPSRHLGLTLAAEEKMNEQIERSADIVGRYVDVERILHCCSSTFSGADNVVDNASNNRGITIAVAKDAAFNFVYRENIAQLKRIGTVVFFSPLNGDSLPDADLVYLPGGYPELFAGQLQQQHRLMSELASYIEGGGRVLAECGGMIFLSKGIIDKDGINRYRFCGILPFWCTMQNARLHLGYRELVDVNGRHWRGHEFHYSDIADIDGSPEVHIPEAHAPVTHISAAVASVADTPAVVAPVVVAKQYNRNGVEVGTTLFRYKNLFAGYTHLYWGETDILKLWD